MRQYFNIKIKSTRRFFYLGCMKKLTGRILPISPNFDKFYPLAIPLHHLTELQQPMRTPEDLCKTVDVLNMLSLAAVIPS